VIGIEAAEKAAIIDDAGGALTIVEMTKFDPFSLSCRFWYRAIFQA
jgi:hypothetical protein